MTDVAVNPEQMLFASTAQAFLDKEASLERVRALHADDVAFDPGWWQGDDVGFVQRCELAAALMRAMPVEVAGVFGEDLLGVAAVEGQERVCALLAC